MRIIAGEHRGRVLEAPEGAATRPTTDRVRESIMSSVFSALGGFDGLRVLDAFAGSGAMGLEAMSRGAGFALLNDASADARRVLRKNADALGYGEGRVRIGSCDVMRSGLPASGGPFGLVFLDPPYRTPQRQVAEIVEAAREAGSLSSGCLVVYEHGEPLEEGLLDGSVLVLRGERRLGKAHVAYMLCA